MEGLNDHIDIALKIFEQHPSILKLRNNVSVPSFSFNSISVEDVELISSKASAHNNKPVKNFKQNWDISSPVLHPIINKSII